MYPARISVGAALGTIVGYDYLFYPKSKDVMHLTGITLVA
jgi:hypothetical protein